MATKRSQEPLPPGTEDDFNPKKAKKVPPPKFERDVNILGSVSDPPPPGTEETLKGSVSGYDADVKISGSSVAVDLVQMKKKRGKGKIKPKTLGISLNMSRIDMSLHCDACNASCLDQKAMQWHNMSKSHQEMVAKKKAEEERLVQEALEKAERDMNHMSRAAPVLTTSYRDATILSQPVQYKDGVQPRGTPVASSNILVPTPVPPALAGVVRPLMGVQTRHRPPAPHMWKPPFAAAPNTLTAGGGPQGMPPPLLLQPKPPPQLVFNRTIGSLAPTDLSAQIVSGEYSRKCGVCLVDVKNTPWDQHLGTEAHKVMLSDYVSVMGMEYMGVTYPQEWQHLMTNPAELMLIKARAYKKSVQLKILDIVAIKVVEKGGSNTLLERGVSMQQWREQMKFTLAAAVYQDLFCDVCEKPLQNEKQDCFNWIEHMLGKEHSVECMKKLNGMDETIYIQKYGHVPGPYPCHSKGGITPLIPIVVLPGRQPSFCVPVKKQMTQSQLKKERNTKKPHCTLCNEAVPETSWLEHSTSLPHANLIIHSIALHGIDYVRLKHGECFDKRYWDPNYQLTAEKLARRLSGIHPGILTQAKRLFYARILWGARQNPLYCKMCDLQWQEMLPGTTDWEPYIAHVLGAAHAKQCVVKSVLYDSDEYRRRYTNTPGPYLPHLKEEELKILPEFFVKNVMKTDKYYKMKMAEDPGEDTAGLKECVICSIEVAKNAFNGHVNSDDHVLLLADHMSFLGKKHVQKSAMLKPLIPTKPVSRQLLDTNTKKIQQHNLKLPPQSLSTVKWELHLMYVMKSAQLLHTPVCRVCDLTMPQSTGNSLVTYALHMLGKKHTKRVVSVAKEIGKQKYLKKYKFVPGPLPSHITKEELHFVPQSILAGQQSIKELMQRFPNKVTKRTAQKSGQQFGENYEKRRHTSPSPSTSKYVGQSGASDSDGCVDDSSREKNDWSRRDHAVQDRKGEKNQNKESLVQSKVPSTQSSVRKNIRKNKTDKQSSSPRRGSPGRGNHRTLAASGSDDDDADDMEERYRQIMMRKKAKPAGQKVLDPFVKLNTDLSDVSSNDSGQEADSTFRETNEDRKSHLRTDTRSSSSAQHTGGGDLDGTGAGPRIVEEAPWLKKAAATSVTPQSNSAMSRGAQPGQQKEEKARHLVDMLYNIMGKKLKGNAQADQPPVSSHSKSPASTSTHPKNLEVGASNSAHKELASTAPWLTKEASTEIAVAEKEGTRQSHKSQIQVSNSSLRSQSPGESQQESSSRYDQQRPRSSQRSQSGSSSQYDQQRSRSSQRSRQKSPSRNDQQRSLSPGTSRRASPSRYDQQRSRSPGTSRRASPSHYDQERSRSPGTSRQKSPSRDDQQRSRSPGTSRRASPSRYDQQRSRSPGTSRQASASRYDQQRSGSPLRSHRESPSRSDQQRSGSPLRSRRESPSRSDQQRSGSPLRSRRAPPSRSDQQRSGSPLRSRRAPPSRSDQQRSGSPLRSRRASPSCSDQQRSGSPLRSRWASPSRSDQQRSGSPLRSRRESPSRSDQQRSGSPLRSRRASPSRSDQQRSGSPLRSRRASPSRSDQQRSGSPLRSRRESPSRSDQQRSGSPLRSRRESPSGYDQQRSRSIQRNQYDSPSGYDQQRTRSIQRSQYDSPSGYDQQRSRSIQRSQYDSPSDYDQQRSRSRSPLRSLQESPSPYEQQRSQSPQRSKRGLPRYDRGRSGSPLRSHHDSLDHYSAGSARSYHDSSIPRSQLVSGSQHESVARFDSPDPVRQPSLSRSEHESPAPYDSPDPGQYARFSRVQQGSGSSSRGSYDEYQNSETSQHYDPHQTNLPWQDGRRSRSREHAGGRHGPVGDWNDRFERRLAADHSNQEREDLPDIRMPAVDDRRESDHRQGEHDDWDERLERRLAARRKTGHHALDSRNDNLREHRPEQQFAVRERVDYFEQNVPPVDQDPFDKVHEILYGGLRHEELPDRRSRGHAIEGGHRREGHRDYRDQGNYGQDQDYRDQGNYRQDQDYRDQGNYGQDQDYRDKWPQMGHQDMDSEAQEILAVADALEAVGRGEKPQGPELVDELHIPPSARAVPDVTNVGEDEKVERMLGYLQEMDPEDVELLASAHFRKYMEEIQSLYRRMHDPMEDKAVVHRQWDQIMSSAYFTQPATKNLLRQLGLL